MIDTVFQILRGSEPESSCRLALCPEGCSSHSHDELDVILSGYLLDDDREVIQSARFQRCEVDEAALIMRMACGWPNMTAFEFLEPDSDSAVGYSVPERFRLSRPAAAAFLSALSDIKPMYGVVNVQAGFLSDFSRSTDESIDRMDLYEVFAAVVGAGSSLVLYDYTVVD
jgi:hypothetical protein